MSRDFLLSARGNVTEAATGIGYGMQKFEQAVDALIGTQSIQERLESVGFFLSYLAPESHLPKELRSEFSEMREKLKRAPSLGEDDARSLASQVLKMARKVDGAYFKWLDSQ